MAKLDKVIENLKPGELIVLSTGNDPSIKGVDGKVKPVLKQPLTSSLIRSLVAEIAPAELKEPIGKGSDLNFAYFLKNNPYTITISSKGDDVMANISCAEEMDDVESTPEIEPPTATHEAAVTGGEIPTREQAELDPLFRKMIELGASDLHLSSNCKPMLRLHGDLVEVEEWPVVTPKHLMKLLHEIMPEQNQEQFEDTHDTDFPYEIKGLSRFRANAFMDRKGPGGVFRQIPFEILTSEQLGLSKEIMRLCFLSKGLVVVTGPTGSGKSTTLAAMIDFINRNRNLHIITIEDPVEFVHPNKQCLINQREVHVHTKSFSNALRAALREDPDILLVGEMRDLETISIAIETAETGHLVFGTLHTTTAASTVDRIIDQFPTDRQAQIRTMLATSLKGVLAQTLLKKKGGGRVAALEVLIVNSAISNLIRDGKIFQIPSVIQTGKSVGMELLNDALMRLVNEELVEPEEAYAKSVDKSGFASLLKTKGIEIDLDKLE